MPGVRKECWCEPWEKLAPFHIAVEGNTKIEQDCPKGSTVYFGAYKDGSKALDFVSMVKFGKILSSNKYDEDTTCSSGHFKQDPAPGA